jgi:PhnB protein
MQIAPYLFFNGQCEEALNFYAKALGGGITALMRYEGSPMDDGKLPPGWRSKIMHANFKSGAAEFMASDGMPGMPAPIYGGFSMSVYVKEDVAQARKIFDALADGGKVTMPFQPPFWGGHFGMLVDAFGVPWMVSTE